MLTSGIRFIGVPCVPILEGVVIMVLLLKSNLQTNRDIENSPVRNIYSRRDRVWEPVDRMTNYNVKCNSFSTPRENSL
jgi:hypothetical protein